MLWLTLALASAFISFYVAAFFLWWMSIFFWPTKVFYMDYRTEFGSLNYSGVIAAAVIAVIIAVCIFILGYKIFYKPARSPHEWSHWDTKPLRKWFKHGHNQRKVLLIVVVLITLVSVSSPVTKQIQTALFKMHCRQQDFTAMDGTGEINSLNGHKLTMVGDPTIYYVCDTVKVYDLSNAKGLNRNTVKAGEDIYFLANKGNYIKEVQIKSY